MVRPVNEHDAILLPESLSRLTELTERTGLTLTGAALTLDSGFDSQENKRLIRQAGLQPVISPNRRNTKEPIAIARLFRWFNEPSTASVTRSSAHSPGRTLTGGSP